MRAPVIKRSKTIMRHAKVPSTTHELKGEKKSRAGAERARSIDDTG
jgi:hypothetical protein